MQHFKLVATSRVEDYHARLFGQFDESSFGKSVVIADLIGCFRIAQKGRKVDTRINPGEIAIEC